LGAAINENPELAQQIGIVEDKYKGLNQAELGKINVEVPVLIEDTGETRSVKQNALQALQEADAEIGKYRALLKCMRAG